MRYAFAWPSDARRRTGAGISSSLFGRVMLGFVLVGGVQLACAGGYLSWQGPAPITWAATQPLSAQMLAWLGPLDRGKDMETSPDPSAAAPAASPGTIGATESTNSPSASPVSVPSAVTPEPAAPLAEVLATLFPNVGGSNQVITVTLPLHFIPPQSTNVKSSTATYSTSKP